MTDTNITFTSEDIAANSTVFSTVCSGAAGPSGHVGGTLVVTDSYPVQVDTGEEHIRRIVAEELAKSEDRIVEKVLRKLNERIRTQ